MRIDQIVQIPRPSLWTRNAENRYIGGRMHCSVGGTQRARVEHGRSKSRWTLIASCQQKELEASEQKPNYNDQIWMHTWARHPVPPQPPHVHRHLDASCRNLSMTACFWIQPKGQYHVGISEYKIITYLSQSYSFWVNRRQWWTGCDDIDNAMMGGRGNWDE